MTVSIVIINYNTFELTCQCIQSIQQHTRDITYEIILVDNASVEVDPSLFTKVFPSIKLVSSDVNLGFAKGCNAGIAHTTGTHILLLNSDTVLKNNAVRNSLEFLKRDPSVAVVTARLENEDGTPQHNCQRFPSVRWKLVELFRVQKFLPRNIGGKLLLGSFFDYEAVVFPDWVWGTFFMFEAKLLDQLDNHRLAEDFFMYGEDIQWCIEFRKLGYSIAFEPAAVVTHLMGKSGGSKSELINRNTEILMKKYYSPFHRWCISLLDKLLK